VFKQFSYIIIIIMNTIRTVFPRRNNIRLGSDDVTYTNSPLLMGVFKYTV